MCCMKFDTFCKQNHAVFHDLTELRKIKKDCALNLNNKITALHLKDFCDVFVR